jgi:hypothetical protein
MVEHWLRYPHIVSLYELMELLIYQIQLTIRSILDLENLPKLLCLLA